MNLLTTKLLAAVMISALMAQSAWAADQFMFRPPEKAAVLPKAEGVFLPGVSGAAPIKTSAPTQPGTPPAATPPNASVGSSPISLVGTDVAAIRFLEVQNYGLAFDRTKVAKVISSQGSQLPNGLYWSESTYGSIVGMPTVNGVYNVSFTLSYQAVGQPTVRTETITWKITVSPPVSELAVLQGPLSMKTGTTYKGNTTPPLSGRWVDRGGMTSKVYYKWTGLPGQVKQTYALPDPAVWLEGWTGSVAGIFNAEIEVTEELWSGTPRFTISKSGKATVTGRDAPILRHTHKAKKTFSIEVVSGGDQVTTANLFRVTIKRPMDYSTSSISEVEFIDRNGNLLPIKSISSNRFLNLSSAPYSSLYNGIKDKTPEVVICPTVGCAISNAPSAIPAVFTVEFAGPVSPFYFDFYSYGVGWSRHEFYQATQQSPPQKPVVERSVDGGKTWGEVTILVNTTKPTAVNNLSRVRLTSSP